MRTSPRLLALALMLALVPSAPAAWADSARAGAKKSAPTVKLLAAGKGKRQKLRYAIPRGTKETVQMDMDMAMSMSMQGQNMDIRLPVMRMRMETEVTEVTDKGHMRYRFRYGGTELLDTPGVAPMVKTSLEQALAGIGTLEGYAVITDRGVTLDGGFELGSAADPQLQQLLGSLEQSLQQLSAPLPTQAVGVGARWEVRSDIENNGVAVSQTARYEIVAMSEDSVTCKVTISQKAKPQTINDPNMPPGSSVEVLSMQGSGSGQVTIPLRRLTPTSQAKIATEMQMRMNMGAQNHDMGMKMTLGMKIAPAPR
ncbi:hypothetical protein [Haliangium sp.]|uniref:hypothetical protein n=1 Tax=Haliangium sp. TaxID=2663208 RepID=UPI003D0E3453